MANLEQQDGSDFAKKSAPDGHVANEAVITAPEQQATLTNSKDADSYPLSKLDLVDNSAEEGEEEATESEEGPRYQPPFHDLLYRYDEDVLEKGIGKLDMQFGEITRKTSELLGKPEIAANGAISLDDLKNTILHADLEKRFTPDEVQSLRLMANQSRRLLDAERSAPATLDMFLTGKLPTDKMFITRQSVQDAGLQLGVFKDA